MFDRIFLFFLLPTFLLGANTNIFQTKPFTDELNIFDYPLEPVTLSNEELSAILEMNQNETSEPISISSSNESSSLPLTLNVYYNNWADCAGRYYCRLCGFVPITWMQSLDHLHPNHDINELFLRLDVDSIRKSGQAALNSGFKFTAHVYICPRTRKLLGWSWIELDKYPYSLNFYMNEELFEAIRMPIMNIYREGRRIHLSYCKYCGIVPLARTTFRRHSHEGIPTEGQFLPFDRAAPGLARSIELARSLGISLPSLYFVLNPYTSAPSAWYWRARKEEISYFGFHESCTQHYLEVTFLKNENGRSTREQSIFN